MNSRKEVAAAMKYMPRWKPRNSSKLKSLGLVASKHFRSPEHPLINTFVEQHIGTLGNWFIFVTWGTYCDSILDKAERDCLPLKPLSAYDSFVADGKAWKSRWPGLTNGYFLRPGKYGGILELAEHLESSAPASDQIKVLIFLTDPEDTEEFYPEDRALIRGAIRNNALYLPTERSASHWAAFEVDHRKKRTKVQPTRPEHEVLGLIAHDRKKLELCEWAVQHRERLKRFKSIVTTGTTGSLIARFLRASSVSERNIRVIRRAASGPYGGDIEIGGEILRGACQHLVFFVDPDTPHAHESDIQALLRTCSMPNVEVNLRLTEKAASSWINTVEE